MVSLTAMRASNARIATDLPPGLVGVFIGATSGIGENSLKAFAKHASKPRAYFVGRSQAAGDRILSELKAINPEGSYVFRKADVSLIKVVDEVCQEIKAKEKAINILFLSPGVLQFHTSELVRTNLAEMDELLTTKSRNSRRPSPRCSSGPLFSHAFYSQSASPHPECHLSPPRRQRLHSWQRRASLHEGYPRLESPHERSNRAWLLARHRLSSSPGPESTKCVFRACLSWIREV